MRDRSGDSGSGEGDGGNVGGETDLTSVRLHPRIHRTLTERIGAQFMRERGADQGYVQRVMARLLIGDEDGDPFLTRRAGKVLPERE